MNIDELFERISKKRDKGGIGEDKQNNEEKVEYERTYIRVSMNLNRGYMFILLSNINRNT